MGGHLIGNGARFVVGSRRVARAVAQLSADLETDIAPYSSLVAECLARMARE